jgi:hypothetical protein
MKLRNYAVAYIVSAIAIMLFVGSINIPKYIALEREGRIGVAAVLSTDCGNHTRITYGFTINGERIVSSSVSPSKCENIHVNDHLRVWYVPNNPRINALSDPDINLRMELFMTMAATILLPLILLLGILIKMPRK